MIMAARALRTSNKSAAVSALTPTAPVAQLSPLPPAGPASRKLDGVLHVLTCGSVDDGKSTLIGRLLFDAGAIYDDQREAITRSAAKTGTPDYSLLVDGLVAEREQGITIDIAWRYFDSSHRRIVIIDSPGHEQYTRNMASGASHADVAIMLVDARSGVKRQTRRHAAILHLMGVKRVVLAINKMDLVGWDLNTFRRIAADFANLTAAFGFLDAVAIPVSAVNGDNVTARSSQAPWFTGPVLLDYLASAPSRIVHTAGPFRMAVQMVVRDGQDFRGLAGTINAGRVCVGDRISDVLSGQSSRVLRIATMDGDLEIASTGNAVAIQLEHDLDIGRGAILSAGTQPPIAARELEVRLVWLSETAFDPKASYLVRTATDLVPVSRIAIESLVELDTMASRLASACGLNDIAVARLTLSRTVAADLFADSPATGIVMLVDALTGASLAGGVILAAMATPAFGEQGTLRSDVEVKPLSAVPFVLTEARLAGLTSDLTDTDLDRAEAARRAGEVIKLLASAGIIAKIG